MEPLAECENMLTVAVFNIANGMKNGDTKVIKWLVII